MVSQLLRLLIMPVRPPLWLKLVMAVLLPWAILRMLITPSLLVILMAAVFGALAAVGVAFSQSMWEKREIEQEELANITAEKSSDSRQEALWKKFRTVRLPL